MSGFADAAFARKQSVDLDAVCLGKPLGGFVAAEPCGVPPRHPLALAVRYRFSVRLFLRIFTLVCISSSKSGNDVFRQQVLDILQQVFQIGVVLLAASLNLHALDGPFDCGDEPPQKIGLVLLYGKVVEQVAIPSLPWRAIIDGIAAPLRVRIPRG